MAKSNSRKLLLLPGDGIGPEVVKEVKKIITSLSSYFKIFLNFFFNSSFILSLITFWSNAPEVNFPFNSL